MRPYPAVVLECVPNVSEGRNHALIDELGAACGVSLLDVHRDADHHRSVFTLAGPGERDCEPAVRALAHALMRRIDLADHDGVHPRTGALDVVPFVALTGTVAAVAREAALEFGAWAADELGTPVFFYGDADEQHRTLPSVRATAFERRDPDVVPARVRPELGAIAVGARPVLVAVNYELDRDDVASARRIAHDVRERDGGLPGVRALGFRLASRGVAQVSMNLVALERTGVEAAYVAVRDAARRYDADVTRVELVGLLPAQELERCSQEFLEWSGLSPSQTIESRLAAVT